VAIPTAPAGAATWRGAARRGWTHDPTVHRQQIAGTRIVPHPDAERLRRTSLIPLLRGELPRGVTLFRATGHSRRGGVGIRAEYMFPTPRGRTDLGAWPALRARAACPDRLRIARRDPRDRVAPVSPGYHGRRGLRSRSATVIAPSRALLSLAGGYGEGWSEWMTTLGWRYISRIALTVWEDSDVELCGDPWYLVPGGSRPLPATRPALRWQSSTGCYGFHLNAPEQVRASRAPTRSRFAFTGHRLTASSRTGSPVLRARRAARREFDRGDQALLRGRRPLPRAVLLVQAPRGPSLRLQRGSWPGMWSRVEQPGP